jgi:hypothetical protein
METREILAAFTAGDSPALGNIWRITAKKTDFYLDPLGEAGTVCHLSVHGPNEEFDRHRFHMRIERKSVNEARSRGSFVMHGVPRSGYAFAGRQLAANAFLVARVRWTWDLQRLRFRGAAATEQAPDIGHNQYGARSREILPPNHARDIDLVVSYGKPYWPDARGSLRDNARLGPLSNDAGIWLTATSYGRSQMSYSSPEGLCPRLPLPSEAPTRIMCGAPETDAAGEIYWFVETITSRQLLTDSAAAVQEQGQMSALHPGKPHSHGTTTAQSPRSFQLGCSPGRSKNLPASCGNGRLRSVPVFLTSPPQRARQRGQEHLHYTPPPKIKDKIKNARAAALGGTNCPPDTTAPGTATGAKKTA